MQKLTRRRLIKQVSISAGAVGMLVTAIPVQAHSETSLSTSTQAAGKSSTVSDEALVICVTPATGSLTVLRGEQETTIKDTALLQRLLAL